MRGISFDKQLELAKSQDTAPDILMKLAKSKYWIVRYYTAINPNTPVKAILEQSKNKKVS
mgnify:FL=1